MKTEPRWRFEASVSRVNRPLHLAPVSCMPANQDRISARSLIAAARVWRYLVHLRSRGGLLLLRCERSDVGIAVLLFMGRRRLFFWLGFLLFAWHGVNYGTIGRDMGDNGVRSYGKYDKPRNEFKPTDDQRKTITYLAIAGITQDEMAGCIGIDKKTLARHFRSELDTGKNQVTGRAIGKLVGLIDEGNLGAICFYLKTKCGWKETTVNEHSGPNGGPIQLQAMRDAVLRAVEDLDPSIKIQVAERLMLTDGTSD